MGLKRKASELEELPISPESANRNTTPSLTSSPNSWTSDPSIQKEAKNQYHYTQMNNWNSIGVVPYLNSRTQKRFRDGRPTEEIIHEITLKKLYEGQKHLQEDLCEQPDIEIHDEYEDQSPIHDNENNSISINFHDNHIEHNQRSIDSFFGKKSNFSQFQQ